MSGFQWAGDACTQIPPSSSPNNLGLILGVSLGVGVPVLVALLVGAGFGIRALRKRSINRQLDQLQLQMQQAE